MNLRKTKTYNIIKRLLYWILYIFRKPSVLDVPDTRDFQYLEILGNISTLPKYKINKDFEVQNQSLQDETKYSCVFYGTSSASNAQSYMLGLNKYISGLELSRIANKEGKLFDFGAYLIDGPKIMKSHGYIDGFSVAKTVDEMRAAIAKGNTIVTGSKYIDWKKAYKAPYIAEKGSGYPHCIAIVGYDDRTKLFTIEQSYGKNKFNKGYMYIRYDDIDLLFTKYVIHTNDNDMYKLNKFISQIKGKSLSQAYDDYKLIGEKDKKIFSYAMQLRFLKKINYDN